MLNIISKIKGKGFSYCVIDAGWYSLGDGDWNGDMGEWNINHSRFPEGFTRTVNAIKEAGMIPGLWFEMECVGQSTGIFEKEEWLLKRDGVPIQTGIRRFWDLRNPQVIEYLSDKVIGILKKYGFGYLKIDYNDNIGIGCDGAESPGEGMRQCLAATRDFINKIRTELPDLVIENCSSGGHRLEPSMQEITSMSSFSDAHECVHIPVVAANVQRAILPEQSQIWAVLRADDDDKRLYYSMINTFLGRMCISGDVCDLSREQWDIVDKGIDFYRKISPVIRDGISRRFGNEAISYNSPEGWQAVVRIGRESAEGNVLVVFHRFKDKSSKNAGWQCRLELPIDERNWKMEEQYGRRQAAANLIKEQNQWYLCVEHMDEMEALAVLIVGE